MDHNTSYSSGGGIYDYYGTVTVTLAPMPTTTLSAAMLSSNTTQNTSNSYGGGIFAQYGGASISGSTVDSNTAYDSGGGIYSNDSSVTVSNGQQHRRVQHLHQARRGRHLCRLPSVTVANNAVDSNTAYTTGGGIYSDGNSVYVFNSDVGFNKSLDGQGGGIAAEAAVYVNASTVDSNTAYDDGGGIYNTEGSVTLVNNSQVNSNTDHRQLR